MDMLMGGHMAIEGSVFYKTVKILADFADWDTTARLNHSLRAWCDYDDSKFHPYETLLGKTMNIMAGVSSSLAYMRLSILQIKREELSVDIEKDGLRDYDVYRYHYIVFSHSIALLQDLLFKLASVIFDLNVTQRMIGWEKLKKELIRNNLLNIKQLFEDFYNRFSTHISKRNTFSHEGLLAYNTLDNFYMTNVWSVAQNTSHKSENKHPEYTRGNERNVELLKETKQEFIDELQNLLSEAEQFATRLCDSFLDKLLCQIDNNFLKNHNHNLKKLNHEPLNQYLRKIGL